MLRKSTRDPPHFLNNRLQFPFAYTYKESATKRVITSVLVEFLCFFCVQKGKTRAVFRVYLRLFSRCQRDIESTPFRLEKVRTSEFFSHLGFLQPKVSKKIEICPEMADGYARIFGL